MAHFPRKSLAARVHLGRLASGLALALWLLPTPGLGADEDLFCGADAAVFGASKVVMSGASRINGDRVQVGSNRVISLSGSAVIEGDAVSGGQVKLSGSSTVLGNVTANAPARTPDSVDDLVSAYATLHANHSIGLTDDGKEPLKDTKLVVSGGDALTLGPGHYFLEKLVLSGGSTLRLAGDVTIYLDGKADLSGGSLAAEAGSAATLLIVGAGASQVKLSGGSNFHGGVYVPGGKFEVTGNGDMYGAAVAAELKLSGGSEIHARDICTAGLQAFPDDDVDNGMPPDPEVDYGMPPDPGLYPDIVSEEKADLGGE